MKMDIYTIINESKDSKLFELDEVENLYALTNDSILFNIVATDEKNKNKEQSSIAKFAEIILKNKDDFWNAKNNDKLSDFINNLSKEIKKKIKHSKKIKKELFEKMNKVAENYGSNIKSSENPNSVVFKLFLSDYNSKYAFTWKAFKETKKIYEKSHVLEGEDIYILKALLEKDPKIDKVVDSTIFSKQNRPLSKEIIDKIKEKIG